VVSRARDPDSRIGDDVGTNGSDFDEAISRIDAQIHFMMAMRNGERLGQLARSGAKLAFVIGPAALFHCSDAVGGLDGAEQDETVGLAFHQHIQHPMRPVAKINVGGAGLVSFDKRPGGRSRESVTGLVVLGQVCFGFHNFTGAVSPN